MIEREIGLRTYIESGVPLDAQLSYDLLATIFRPSAPLHDGAVIVKKDRIAAAACFLPLSINPLLSTQLGTRHRAGIGITEETDAISVIVSEETGGISLAVAGQVERDLSPERLRERMSELLMRTLRAAATAPIPTPARRPAIRADRAIRRRRARRRTRRPAMISRLRHLSSTTSDSRCLRSPSPFCCGTAWRAIPRRRSPLRIPVEFYRPPEGSRVQHRSRAAGANPPPRPGPRAARTHAESVHAMIDLCGAIPGEHTYDLSADQIQVPQGVEIKQVIPSRLRLVFDRARDPPGPGQAARRRYAAARISSSSP